MTHQPDKWVLKGGFALQLRLGDRARTTKDIDVLSMFQQKEILSALRQAGSLDFEDWFQFEVSASSKNSDEDPGGVRYQIRALLDGRIFERFHVDVGLGDAMLDPVEYLQTPDLLEFAGIDPAVIPCFPINQQIAEKLHAYTRPYPTGSSTRVKDIVDILLLAGLGEINGKKLFEAIQATFHSRGTHPLPMSVPAPPRNWSPSYRRLARQVELGYPSLQEAFEAIQLFLDPLLSHQNQNLGRWDPSQWDWE
jgi:hypothetical protein